MIKDGGNIIRSNSLTMWEGFDDIESHSHAWGMYPVRLIQEYMLGISFDSIIKNKVRIVPQIVKRVKNLSGKNDYRVRCSRVFLYLE